VNSKPMRRKARVGTNLSSRQIRRNVQAARGHESDSLLGIFFLLAASIGGVVAFALHEVFQMLQAAMEVSF
jgi:hypothetical protein